jgi:DNA repair exonuclease SbcCD ATPase subunit
MAKDNVRLSATNIGGIDNTEVEIQPGVTVLEGRNATNRTSLLQAIMAALGSESVSLKGDASSGSVELTMAGETYTRTLERRDGTVVSQGDPYLESPELAELFAFLLESNEARRAVARAEDLRDLIMEPVDTDSIKSEIGQLEAEKRQVDDDISELESLKRDLPELEQEQNRIKSDIEKKRAELEEKEFELENTDADLEETRQEKTELEDKLTELRETRSDLEDVRFDVETEEESLKSLRQEQAELESDAAELSDTPIGNVEEIEARISRLRDRKQTLNSEVNELQTTIQFNEGKIEESGNSTLSELSNGSESNEPVTNQLLAENETVTCWTCGSDVERKQVETTLAQLREMRQEKLDEVQTLENEIDELAEEKRQFESRQQQNERIERRLDDIENEIEDRQEKLDRLRDRRETLTDEIGHLEEEINALEQREHSEILDLHKEANQLEFELERLEGSLDDVRAEISSIEDKISKQQELEERRSTIQDELQDLRTRIDQIEQQAVDQFNRHMETVLDILDYENLERIWIERTEKDVRQGRRKVSKASFDLHIVRQSDSGTTYEDTIDHLSESEREVTGLVFALAGYLVHDVHETVPFILLDSLEAIDSQRIATLIDYLQEYVAYLVVALLPEDAAAMDTEYHRVKEM